MKLKVYGVYSYSTHGGGATLKKIFLAKPDADTYRLSFEDNRDVVYAVETLEVF